MTDKSSKSQSQMYGTAGKTAEFRENYEAIFGERKPVRGTWVAHPKTGELVPAEEYVPEHIDERQPLFTDRYMEGVRAVDGTDISSRQKRKEYMRLHNLADFDDFKNTTAKAAEKRREYLTNGKTNTKAVRETVGRALYESRKKGNRK
jgi:hypothetical protein